MDAFHHVTPVLKAILDLCRFDLMYLTPPPKFYGCISSRYTCVKGDFRSGFPLGLENLENLEKWEGIFQSGKSQGILNRLEKSGKSQGKSHKILENSGNFRQILFFIF